MVFVVKTAVTMVTFIADPRNWVKVTKVICFRGLGCLEETYNQGEEWARGTDIL